MSRFTIPGLLLPIFLASGLAAQEDPRLAEAVRLAREGMGDSARAVAGRALAVTAPTDPLYPEVLYTVALVAGDAKTKRLYLQRVAIEFSRSAPADEARLELAQLDYADRDLDSAVRHVAQLLTDYPDSPLRATAALWGAMAAFEKRDFPLACQWASQGMSAPGVDVELRNQLDFQRQRCQAMLSESTPARPAPPPTPAPPPPPPQRAGPQWFIQVAAFRTQEQADQVAMSLRGAGIATRVVVEGGLHKVRAGPYPSRSAADQAMPGVQRRVGGQPFIIRVP